MRAIRNLIFACALATPALADPLTLVALGDSLTAGYGLPQEDGFVPQLQAWLTAQGQDRIQIGPAGRGVDPAQQVVAAQRDDHRIHLGRQ